MNYSGSYAEQDALALCHLSDAIDNLTTLARACGANTTAVNIWSASISLADKLLGISDAIADRMLKRLAETDDDPSAQGPQTTRRRTSVTPPSIASTV